MIIRPATPNDVAACVGLVESRREQYERYEPRFWKKAWDSKSSTYPWFARLFDETKSFSLVAAEGSDIVGFLVAREAPVPPVYDPGGPTALIDDFCVVEKRWCDVGGELLAAARAELRNRGYVQIVVVGARRDEAKTAFLEGSDLSLASTWWTAAT